MIDTPEAEIFRNQVAHRGGRWRIGLAGRRLASRKRRALFRTWRRLRAVDADVQLRADIVALRERLNP